jgi:hypothetical protein
MCRQPSKDSKGIARRQLVIGFWGHLGSFWGFTEARQAMAMAWRVEKIVDTHKAGSSSAAIMVWRDYKKYDRNCNTNPTPIRANNAKQNEWT